MLQILTVIAPLFLIIFVSALLQKFKNMGEKFEPSNSEKSKIEDSIEKLRMVESFTTEHGSTYCYDENGHMFGTKVVRGMSQTKLEAQEKTDITVFVDIVPTDLEAVKKVIKARDKKVGEQLYVIEKQLDGTSKIIRNISEIIDPDELSLAIVKNNAIAGYQKATLMPTKGFNHFGYRSFKDQNGERQTERSLGGKVTEVVYKK